MDEDQSYAIGEVRFSTSVRHQHTAETYGLKFRLGGQVVSFLVDTKFFPGLIESYGDSDILVIHVVKDTPFEDKEILHLTLEDARRIITAVRPRRAVLTHFGMAMLKADPLALAMDMQKELGIEVTAATDGLRIDLGGGE